MINVELGPSSPEGQGESLWQTTIPPTHADARTLERLEPEACARLRQLDATSWGRHRYASEAEASPALPHSSHPDRILEYLERVRQRGQPYQELARVLLYGLAAGFGAADLHNTERRLGVHHLPLMVRRFDRCLQEARQWVGLDPQVLPLRMPRAAFARLGRRVTQMSASGAEPSLLERVAYQHALHRTYLQLRQEAEALTGAPEDESFQAVRRPDGTEKDAFKAHLWYELADVIFLGGIHRLMRVTLTSLAEAFWTRQLGGLLELYVQGRWLGEGRAHRRLRALLDALVTEEARVRFLNLGDRFFACIERHFRQAAELSTAPWSELDAELDALKQHWEARPPLDPWTLSTFCRTHRQQAWRQAEDFLEQVAQARHVRRETQGLMPFSSTRAREKAWSALVLQLQAVQKVALDEQTPLETLLTAGENLRQALEHAADAAHQAPEFLHWPGDGEDYRTRRQRATAEADRFSYLMGMGERLLLALTLYAEADPAQRPPFQSLVAEHEGCLFVEEWVAHFGPRLETILGGALPPLKLLGNQRILALDRAVRALVSRARAQGGARELWGWMLTGVTDRLRELLRRHGLDSSLHQRLEQLLEQGKVHEAERLITSACTPGQEPTDLDAYVTVGVHIFNADTRIVRENLLHNQHLDWPEERRWLLIGSSSAQRQIAERERLLCLEAGVTHYFLSARRHQKAGNQNRVMPNIPAHPEGRTYYLTLDDDYLSGPQTLQRLVSLAERHPESAFVQLPLYLFGNHLLGISRARLADASGMCVWGSLTSLGMRDLRFFPDGFANRRSLALPFGTCTLFRLSPQHSSFLGTGGMYTDTVCEDFAQGLLAFSLKHVHHPRPPVERWQDGILLNEIWIEGDGVELFGRIRQQSRWCEGSVRNGWEIWLPSVFRQLRQRFGLEPMPDVEPPSWPQLFGGTVMVLGYGLELAGIVLFMVGFPLTSLIAEYSDTLGHTLKFWAGLWSLHLLYSYYLAWNCGLSLRAFLDQHYVRFSSVMGLAEGFYRSLRSPANGWAACKDARVQINAQVGAVYLGVAALNVLGAVVGAYKGMTIYYLCLISSLTALWQFQLRGAWPIWFTDRVAHLPRRVPRAWLAWQAFKREGQREEHAQDLSRPIPWVMPITFALMILTILAMSARYVELLPRIPSLLYHHPIFLSWLLASDVVQVLSTAWIWMFVLAGVRNQPHFTYPALVEAGRRQEPPTSMRAQLLARAARLAPLGKTIEYLGGWRDKATRRDFWSASGAWLALALLALVLRLPHLDMNGAFMDESYYIDAGRRFLSEGINLGVARVMFGSYLYPVLTALASYAGGLEGSRLLSQLFGVLTALSVAQVGHRVGGHALGILSGLLVACAYQAVYISALATYDAASVAGVAFSLGAFATAMWGRGAAERSERQRLTWLGVSGGALLLGVLAKYVALVFIPGMLVAVGVFTHLERTREASQPQREATARLSPVLLKRLLAFGGPVLGGGFLYGLSHLHVLAAWWDFSRSYTTLVTSDARTLTEIYFVKGWNVLLALGLAGVGIWTAPRLSAWVREEASRLRWILTFLAAQVVMFYAFHVATRADVNYLKHINYAFPFLMPLVALGLLNGAERVWHFFESHGLSRSMSRWMGVVVMSIPILLLGLREVDVLKGALHWWPDLRPYALALETGIRPTDHLLVDDTGMIYYTLPHKVQVDSPFYATIGNRSGEEAVVEGVRQQLYDVIVLDGGITPEGEALHKRVAPLLYPAGYVRVYVSPDSPPMAGMFVAPRHRARFEQAGAVGTAWMEAWYQENKSSQ